MTCYVDRIENYGVKIGRAGPLWCHLTTDGDEDELHRVAHALHLQRRYCSDHTQPEASYLHYDLTPGPRDQAVKKHGVIDIAAIASFDHLRLMATFLRTDRSHAAPPIPLDELRGIPPPPIGQLALFDGDDGAEHERTDP